MPTTPRGSLPWPQDSDDPDVPDDMRLLAERIAQIIAMDDQGPLGSRPAPGVRGRFYTDQATGITYRDDGSNWRALNAPAPDAIPTGLPLPWGGPDANIPPGFLICEGQAVSRATYAALFTVLGGASSPYGLGDGSTTFNVPDYRGRVLWGRNVADVQGRISQTGHTDGAADYKRHPAHSHGVSIPLPAHTHNDNLAFFSPDHAHGFSLSANGNTSVAAGDSFGAPAGSFRAAAAADGGGHFHGISIPVAGSIGGGGHWTTKNGAVGNPTSAPPISGSTSEQVGSYATVVWIIKT